MASINLDPQPSGSNQDSEERNEVVLPGQGPQRASIARDRSQKSTQGKHSERGKKTDVKKIALHERCSPFAMNTNTYVLEEGSVIVKSLKAFYKRFRDASS